MLNRIIKERALIFFSTLIFASTTVFAQVEAPDREELFQEDTKIYKRSVQDRSKELLNPLVKSEQPLDFKAPEISYDQESETFIGSGGVLLSHSDLKIRADSGKLGVKTREASFLGDVQFTTPDLRLGSDEAHFNIDSETGEFINTDFYLPQGGYSVQTSKMLKLSEFDFAVVDAEFSTCECDDKSKPWSINCSKAKITDGGYTHAYNTSIDLYGVPIFYSPYLVFPSKRERASGLLAPEYGYSNRDGFMYSQPIYAVLDGSSDLMLTPFTQAKTRTGVEVDYREMYSQRSNIETRFIYSDESAREGQLRGTNTAGVFDPTIDENRWGGFLRQSWRSQNDASLPMSMISDVHLISDDLFLREIDDEEIGFRGDRFTTSRVALRSSFADYWSTELSTEYNQSIESDDDFVFQRLPEFNLNYSRSFRPFGFNPYGLKLGTNTNLVATQFYREAGYDGTRVDFSPKLHVPYNYKNYLNGQLFANMNQTNYFTNNQQFDAEGNQEASDDRRQIYQVGATIGTALEKVYDLSPSNPLVYLSSIGAQNQDQPLKRVKSLIEPTLRYVYVPEKDQQDLPFYDSLDRLRNQNNFTYGVRNSFWGKRESSQPAMDEIAEFTPMLSDLPRLGTSYQLADPGFAAPVTEAIEQIRVRSGNIQELAFYELRQNYDYFEEREDRDPNRGPWSDIAFNFGITPSPYFGFLFESDIAYKDQSFNRWAISSHLRDDRGDQLRIRYTFIEDTNPGASDPIADQIEASAEIKIVDQLKLGYYARFDDIRAEFIENAYAFRFAGSCNCWYVDLGYQERLNPDRQSYIMRFTLQGLGDLVQNISLDDEREQQR